MRIAYILLCHKNPQQVDGLIRKLRTEDTDFYVHVDKKATEFMLSETQNVVLLPIDMRVDVRWARRSMVEVTLAAIDCVFASGNHYDYVCLLSGQDFPIKSNAEIGGFLDAHRGANYIDVLDHSEPMYTRYSKRNALHYPVWMQSRTFIARAAKKLYIYLTGGDGHTFLFARRKNTTGLGFEFGSQWWCLTFDCLCWIREYVSNNPKFLDFFEYSLVPDECFFQTLFMASPYKSTRREKLTYLEWDKNRNNPRILRESDVSRLIKSECLFARKFDITVDRGALECLNRMI